MRILDLHFQAYGPFTDVRLDFSSGCLHVVHGPNEAGKSSARCGLRDWLCDFPKPSNDEREFEPDFVHKAAKLRVGGRLRHSDGTEVTFYRRRGKKDTASGPDGKALRPDALAKFLMGVTVPSFSSLFALDEHLLRAGAEDLLRGRGAVGAILFSASLGIAGVQDALKKLQDEAEALFKPGGRAGGKISVRITEYQEAQRKVSAAALSGREWASLDEDLRRNREELATVQSAIADHSREEQHIRRLQQAIPSLAAVRELRESLAGAADVPVLSADFSKRRTEAETRLRDGEAKLIELRGAIDVLRVERDSLVVPAAILETAAAIDALVVRLGDYGRMVKDLRDSLSKGRLLEAEVAALVPKIGASLTTEQAAKMRLTEAQRSRVQALAQQHQALLAAKARAVEDVAKCEGEIARIQKELSETSPPRDVTPLKSAIDAALREGEIEAQRDRTALDLRAKENMAAIELRKLGLWSGPLAEVEKVAVPSTETIERYEGEISAAITTIDRLDVELRKEASGKEELDRQLDAIRQAGVLPTEEMLAQARERRERLWSLVRRAWKEGADAAAEARSIDPERELSDAYEHAVRAVDETADRLRREADRVARYADLSTRTSLADKQVMRLRGEHLAAVEHGRRVQERWAAEWTPAGIQPKTPREMRGWCGKLAKLVEIAKGVREHSALLEDFDRRISGHRTALDRAVIQFGGPAGATLRESIDRAREALEASEKLRLHRETLELRRREVLRERDGAGARERTNSRAVETWQSEWALSVGPIGLNADALPAEATAVIEKVTELQVKLGEIGGLTRRIEGMKRDTEAFVRDARDATELAPDLASQPADRIVEGLRKRLEQAKTDSTTREQKRTELQKKERELSAQHEAVTLARTTLGQLCVAAGCPSPEGLEATERRCREVEKRRTDLANEERLLKKLAYPETIVQLEEQSLSIDVNALPARIEELTRALEKLQSRRSELERQIGSGETKLAQWNGRSAAADSAEDAQRAAAEARSLVERYIPVRLATSLLRQAMARYHEQNQDAVLRRAGELFAKLTSNSFSRVERTYGDGDEQVILGVRGTGEQLTVAQMSDGTRDQLFLALRLAALERTMESAEPVPFVADDVLVRFDDARAKAALEVLLDVAKKTQVILFTHHEKVVELARSVGAPGDVLVHELVRQ